MPPPANRRFLFLQGPHGPFFTALAAALRDTGAGTIRAGINGGDRLFWRAAPYHHYAGPAEDWPDWLETLAGREGITDLVLYGSGRPIHRAAIVLANRASLTCHTFEEGYIRPWWISYERGGTGGTSRLTRTSIAQMEAALGHAGQPPAPIHDRWGEIREHLFWSAAYHATTLAARRPDDLPPHRGMPVSAEFALAARELLRRPATFARRRRATRRLMRAGRPYHLVLLQLAHDATMRETSPFASQAAFIDHVAQGFAAGAPLHHHLVFKAHPLEDNREPLEPLITAAARRHGLENRTHFIAGGKLAHLMDEARSAVTINSTSAEQALWRGLPVRAFGRAAYTRPELTSAQPLADFLADPVYPDPAAYQIYRSYLLATSQIPGGFYAASGRRRLLMRLPDAMLSPSDPYDALANPVSQRAHMPAAIRPLAS